MWKWNANECVKRYVDGDSRDYGRGLYGTNKYQNLKLNKWELLAGMQALFIYIIIRLDEGETEQNNLDSLLLATVTVGVHCTPVRMSNLMS